MLAADGADVGQPSAARSIADATQFYLRNGYVVFPGVLPVAILQQLREMLEALRSKLGEVVPHARTPYEPAPGVEVSGTGLVFKYLLEHCPEAAERILVSGPAAVVRALLGSGARPDMVGGVLTDHTRPFFAWHQHVGGPDDTHLRRAGVEVADAARPRRLTYLLYLDGAGESDGPLHMLPAPIGQPRRPQGGEVERDWPGQHVVTFPAGSVVLIDERTWHAVPQRTTPGSRHWIGMYMAAADVPMAAHQDTGLTKLGLNTLAGWRCVPGVVGR